MFIEDNPIFGTTEMKEYTIEMKNYINGLNVVTTDNIETIVNSVISQRSSEIVSTTQPESQEIGAIWLKLL